VSLVTISSLLLISCFLALSLLHLYWAFGGRLGFHAAVPTVDAEPLFVPGTASCIAVGVGLMAAAAVTAIRANLVSIDLPPSLPRFAVWALAAVFAARAVGDFRYVGFFKRIKGTTFARRDSLFYSPLCALIAMLACVIAYG